MAVTQYTINSKAVIEFSKSTKSSAGQHWIALDCAVFYVPANTAGQQADAKSTDV